MMLFRNKYACIFIIYLSVQSLYGLGQSMAAEYKVIKSIDFTKSNGQVVNVANLELNAQLFKTGSQYYSFSKALYLDKYPDGYIDFAENSEAATSIVLNMNPIQNCIFKDLDSLRLVWLSESNIVSEGKVYKNKYNPKNFNWHILPETKTIFGLQCQKATLYRPGNGEQLYEIWFCADVPITAGPGALVFCPGLVVEAKDLISKQLYTLTSYSLNAPIPEGFKGITFFKPFIK